MHTETKIFSHTNEHYFRAFRQFSVYLKAVLNRTNVDKMSTEFGKCSHD